MQIPGTEQGPDMVVGLDPRTIVEALATLGHNANPAHLRMVDLNDGCGTTIDQCVLLRLERLEATSIEA